METWEALNIIRALADGKNPATGETCKEDSVLQQIQTVRALEKAVSALESEAERSIKRSHLPAKVGKLWLAAEEEQLCAEFDRGMSIREIAKLHGRLRGGITARLERLGKIPCQVAMNFCAPSGDAGGRGACPSQATSEGEVVKPDLALAPDRPWQRDEDARICTEFYRHVDLGQIGRDLGRNRLAVYSRLVSLGKIRPKGQSHAA